MFLLNSSNFLTDAGAGQDDQPAGSGQAGSAEGRITSAAWEGWWYDGAA
ncbi:hypothetical protein ACIQCN_04230 [Pseudarthrobacter sp. NPDC092424]